MWQRFLIVNEYVVQACTAVESSLIHSMSKPILIHSSASASFLITSTHWRHDCGIATCHKSLRCAEREGRPSPLPSSLTLPPFPFPPPRRKITTTNNVMKFTLATLALAAVANAHTQVRSGKLRSAPSLHASPPRRTACPPPSHMLFRFGDPPPGSGTGLFIFGSALFPIPRTCRPE